MASSEEQKPTSKKIDWQSAAQSIRMALAYSTRHFVLIFAEMLNEQLGELLRAFFVEEPESSAVFFVTLERSEIFMHASRLRPL